jgi:hypothetical protein
MNAMKTYFMRRTRREKFLVLALVSALAAVWLVTAGGRLRARWQEHRSVASERADQKLWLERRPAIEERAARAVKNLNPARTLDATHLVGEISALAAQAGLSPGIDPPHTERTPQFAYHTVQVSVRRAALESLVKFYRALGERAPYLALEHCAIVADRANPAQLNASFTIFSVEVLR